VKAYLGSVSLGEIVLMRNQNEGPALAMAEASHSSPKLTQLLRKRLRQLLRVATVLAACLALSASAFAIWWLTSLNGLPDIGEPFDVEAFRAQRVPDQQDAFTFLRRAVKKTVPITARSRGATPEDLTFSWSIADPKLREWAEANRAALELFQQGAERSDAACPDDDSADDLAAGNVIWVALLEGSRRQESGDTGGSWDCYRAVLRMLAHVWRRGGPHQRYRAKDESRWLGLRLATWASDPKTTIPELRASLDEVLKNEPTPEWDSFAVKSGYLAVVRALERPMPPFTQEEMEGEWTFRFGDMGLSPNMVRSIEAAQCFVLREPERSRRVLRLLCANYLAHAQTRPLRKPAAWASLSVLTSTNPIRAGKISVPIYHVSPEAPAGARALAPKDIASWLVATHDARLRVLLSHVSAWPWPPDLLAHRRTYRNLVIMLAAEIYRRERGALPTSEDALVGTYLKSLPDDDPTEFDNLSAPILR
jgi:hypothetical protein